MRILVTSDWYPDDAEDPAGSFVRNQALAVAKRHEVAVLHLASPVGRRARPRLTEEQDGSLPTMRVQRPAGPPLTAGNLAATAGALRRLRARGFEPDLIHAHEVGAAFAAVRAGGLRHRPVVVSVHFSGFALGKVHGISARLARTAFARADVVCPVSHSLRQRMEQAGWPGRFRVVPNVVDVDRFVPGDPAVGVPRIAVVAALTPVKGIEQLVEAAGVLARDGTSFCIDLVGDGELRNALSRRIRELGLLDRVVLHGRLPPDEVAAIMRRASFAVVPSVWETFSVVLSEAMACGLPVVATAVGALPERVDERNGILVEPGDPACLADGIARMLRHHRSYDRASIAAAVRDQLSPEAVATAWDAIYDAALDGRMRSGVLGRAS